MRQAILCLALRDFGMLCPDSDILRRAALVLGESADTGRIVGNSSLIDSGRVARYSGTIANVLR